MRKPIIRLGGVPEHFNLPIHLAIEDGRFEARGIQVEWTTFKGGTGQMTKALREGVIDACILLTEGIIKDILAGNPSKIISGYIKTPLIWGIHTGASNDLKHHSEIYDKRYAISRFGSGSHLMSIVDATVHEKRIEKEQFHIIKNLEGALDSLESVRTDVFYWEKYTTKPYVDSGQLKRIGEFITPWPCFVIAATDHIVHEQKKGVIEMLQVIHESCAQFMERADNISLVAKRYDQKVIDVERWYHATEWATHGWVSNKMLESVVQNLKVADIIDDIERIPDLVWKRNKE